jgi:hypothetical protein
MLATSQLFSWVLIVNQVPQHLAVGGRTFAVRPAERKAPISLPPLRG